MKIFAPFCLFLCITVANPVYGAGDAGDPLPDDKKYIEWVKVEEVLDRVELGSGNVEELAEFFEEPKRILPEGFYCGVNYTCSDGWDGTEYVPPPSIDTAEIPIPLPITLLGLALIMLTGLRFTRKKSAI